MTAARAGGPQRHRGVDVARGLAVLGMFGAHLLTTEELVWSDRGTWSGIVDGRSSILFAVLAGVSVALLTGRGTPPSGAELVRARLVLLTRAVLVLAAGSLVQLLVVPVAVILEFYAVLFVLCIPLLRWRPRALAALGVVLVVVVNPLFHRQLLPWVLAGTDGGGVLGELLVTGFYPAVLWSAFVVAGLAIGRLDLGAGRVRAGLVLGGFAAAVLGYGAGALVADPLLVADPHSGTPAEVVGSGGFAVLVLGLCLLVADRLRWVLLPLAAVGSMPLTAYCAHLVGIAVVADAGAGDDGGWSRYLWFAGAALVGCTAWALVLGRGPLERVLAAVTARTVRA